MYHEDPHCTCSHCRIRSLSIQHYSGFSVFPHRCSPYEHCASYSAFQQLFQFDEFFLEGQSPGQ